jgi:membrane-associated protease RseP (regulator of RpoE activity)
VLSGLKAGDKILAINQVPVKLWSDVEPILAKSVGKDTQIKVLRNGVEQTFVAKPVILDLNGVSRAYLGVYLKIERIKESPVGAVGQLGSMMQSTAQLIVQLPLQAVSAFTELNPSSQRDQNGAISIIGLGQYSGQIAANTDISLEDKVASQLGLLMSLNIALFVFNMVPLVPLDGGHIAAGIYEWIKRGIWRLRGRTLTEPVDTRRMMPVAYVVGGLLLFLSLVLILRDILNPLQM